MEYFCVFCGRKLERQKRKFCSNSCKCKYFYKTHPEKCNLWNKKRPKIKHNCKVCGKECGRKFYCSKECKELAYYFDDEKYWKNLERLKSMKKHRDKNKKDFLKEEKSRKLTRDMFNKKQIKFTLNCKECKSFLKLEIHHELYPQTREQIKQAVKDKKIYLLCKFCHSNINKIFL